MTTALIKELLLDASLRKLSFELNADLISAVEQVLSSGVFNDQEIAWFDLYLSGYNAQDIAERYITTDQPVIDVLKRIFTAIAHTSGYTDDTFIYQLKKSRPISPLQMNKILKTLELYSNDYLTYERM